MPRRIGFALLVFAASAAGLGARIAASRPSSAPAQTSAADAAFAAFFAASSPEEAARLTDPILRAGVTFDDAYRRLQRGRVYEARDTGVVRMDNRTADGIEHFFAVTVPEHYDPARRYQVRIQLHGGV